MCLDKTFRDIEFEKPLCNSKLKYNGELLVKRIGHLTALQMMKTSPNNYITNTERLCVINMNVNKAIILYIIFLKYSYPENTLSQHSVL